MRATPTATNSDASFLDFFHFLFAVFCGAARFVRDPSYYTILGVNTNATEHELKKAHRNVSFKYHPDKNAHNPEWAKRLVQIINEAFETLIDPKLREIYDINGPKAPIDLVEFTAFDNAKNQPQVEKKPQPETKVEGNTNKGPANPPQKNPASPIDKKYQDLLIASDRFGVSIFEAFPDVKIPILQNRMNQVYKGKPSELIKAADATNVIIHDDAIDLIIKYCVQKKIVVTTFVKRLITHRPIVSSGNLTIPRMDEDGDQIPYPDKNDYIDYSEMLFAALLQISSPSRFINDAGRENRGHSYPPFSFIEEGHITSVVGPRYNLKSKMDNQFTIIYPKSKLTIEDGSIEKLLHDYYFDGGLKWLSYAEIEKLSPDEKNKRYTVTSDGKGYFDKIVYGKRLRLAIIPYVLNANRTAKNANKKAYLFVNEWELESWKGAKDQGDLFIEEFFKVLTELEMSSQLSHIEDVNFSWIPNRVFDSLNKKYLTTVPEAQITFWNTKNNPAGLENFKYPVEDKMLFVSVGVSGNAYIGNEYWVNNLKTAEGAIAAASVMSELQNPEINPEFVDRIIHLGSSDNKSNKKNSTKPTADDDDVEPKAKKQKL